MQGGSAAHPPSCPLPERKRIIWHPAPGAVAEKLREFGVWRRPHSKEILFGCKGESASQPGKTKRKPAAEAGKRPSPSTHPHLHTPISPGQGDARFLALNLGSHHRSPSRRVVPESPWSALTPGRPALPATLPPPRPAPRGAYLSPALPPDSPGAERGTARSRRVPRLAAGPRASWLQGARSLGLRGGRTAREPGKEGSGELGRGGGSEGGGRGPGQLPEPPERTRAQPRGRSGRAAPGAGGRVRRSRRASERAWSEREEGGGWGRVCAERVQGGRGRASGQLAGGAAAAPGVPAATSGRRPVGPAKFKANSLCVLGAERFLSLLTLPAALPGQARLESTRTIFQTVRWRPGNRAYAQPGAFHCLLSLPDTSQFQFSPGPSGIQPACFPARAPLLPK